MFNNLPAPFLEKITAVTALLEPSDLLAAEPANPTEIRIGYARVSTGGQRLERQLDALKAAGCRRVFAEKQSGRDTDRPELAACLDFLQPGDTLVVPSMDRLSRSLQDLITTVGQLRTRGVGFTSLHENLDTTTPGGRLVFHVFAALAEFIREIIVSGTREGLAAARARGPGRGTAERGHPRDHPSGAGHAAQPREQHHLDREDPRSEPRDAVQPRPRPAGAAGQPHP